MRRIAVLAAVFLLLMCAWAKSEQENLFRIENGMAQPVIAYTNPQDPDYTNHDSEILRFAVYVETDYDTDMDGKPDLIKTLVQVPRTAAEGSCRVPAIYEARPYIAGMYTYSPELPAVGFSDFDEQRMYATPVKRIAEGEISSPELAGTAKPEDWYYQLDSDPFGQQYLGNLTAYDYFLVRGFAVVQSAGPGTWGSEGLECCTSDLETAAFRCVVEWLTGDRNAFSDKEKNIRVEADWCDGKVAMTGRSYAGALAFEVASTGVKGLETIVPVAGVASWYDYGNTQGIPSGILGNYDFIADLAMLCASRFPSENETELEKIYERYLASLRDAQIDLAGDYGPFWTKRDYSSASGFHGSALIVQGMNDETVKPKQFDLMRSALLHSGCEVRCLLHQNGHVTPANEQTKTDILIGKHTFTEWLNLWFTHTLLGVDNEAARMPDMTVQHNTDGEFVATEEWNTGHKLQIIPENREEYTVFAGGAHRNNTVLLQETFDGTSGEDHLLWRTEIRRETTVNGPASVHLRVKTEDTDKKMLMIGAVLVDRADEPFPCFETGSVGVLEQRVIRKNGVDRGENTEPYDLVEWVQTETRQKIIAYGAMDLRNPEAGYLPSSATTRDEPIRAGEWYDYTLWLQPAFYTIPAGHHLELYIVPFCGFSGDYAAFDSSSAEELAEAGMDPDAMVPFTRDYSFTVDNGASCADIPVMR